MSSRKLNLSRFLLRIRVIPNLRLYLLLLVTFFQPMALAQNADNFLDVDDVPSREEIEDLLIFSGALEGLSDKEKEHTISYTYKIIALSQVQSVFQTHQACQSDVKKFCSSESNDDIDACLLGNQDKLSVCCASNTRQKEGIRTGIPEPITYAGINLPKGSELYFYDDCALNEIKLSQTVSSGDLQLGPGMLRYGPGDQLASAVIKDAQVYHGLPISNANEHGTNLHKSGVPVEVLVAKDVDYHGMNISAGSMATFNDDGTLFSITADEAFTDSHGRVLIGKVEFYSSGDIKSGVLGEPWTNSTIVLPQNSRVRFSIDGGFESVVTSQSRLWGGDHGVHQELLTHPNGQIKSIRLSSQSGIAIDGIAYPEHATLEFDRDGRVLRDNFRDKQMEPAYPVSNYRQKWQVSELLETKRIGVWDVPKNSVLFKDDQGVLRIITASKPMRYKNMELAAGHYEVTSNGTRLWLNALSKPFSKEGLYLPAETKVVVGINGTLSSAEVIDGTTYKALKLKPSSLIRFHKSGLVKTMTLDVGAELADHTFSTFAEIEFEKSGELRTVVADEPVKISNMEFDGNWIFFHPSGNVRSGILNVSTRANGILYAAGTEVLLDDSGQVTHSWRRKPRWPDGKPPPAAPTSYTDGFGNVISVDIVGPSRVLRVQLMGPLNHERCIEIFGEKYVAGNYPKKGSHGSSIVDGGDMSPAALGCGTTDEQAGILERN